MEKLKSIFFDLCDKYEWVEDMVSALRSIWSCGEITEDEYHIIQSNWDNWLKEWEQAHPDAHGEYFE